MIPPAIFRLSFDYDTSSPSTESEKISETSSTSQNDLNTTEKVCEVGVRALGSKSPFDGESSCETLDNPKKRATPERLQGVYPEDVDLALGVDYSVSQESIDDIYEQGGCLGLPIDDFEDDLFTDEQLSQAMLGQGVSLDSLLDDHEGNLLAEKLESALKKYTDGQLSQAMLEQAVRDAVDQLLLSESFDKIPSVVSILVKTDSSLCFPLLSNIIAKTLIAGGKKGALDSLEILFSAFHGDEDFKCEIISLCHKISCLRGDLAFFEPMIKDLPAQTQEGLRCASCIVGILEGRVDLTQILTEFAKKRFQQIQSCESDIEQAKLFALVFHFAFYQKLDELRCLIPLLKSESIWNEILIKACAYALARKDSDLFDLFAPELESLPSYVQNVVELIENKKIPLGVRRLLLSRVLLDSRFTENVVCAQKAISSLCIEAYENSELSLGDEFLGRIEDPTFYRIASIEKDLTKLYLQISVLGYLTSTTSEGEDFNTHNLEQIYFGNLEKVDTFLADLPVLERNKYLKKISNLLLSVKKFDLTNVFIERFCMSHPDLHLILSSLAIESRKCGVHVYYDKICHDSLNLSTPCFIKAFVLAGSAFNEWSDVLQRLSLLDPVQHLDFTFKMLEVLFLSDNQKGGVQFLRSFIDGYLSSVSNESGVSLLREKIASLFLSQDKIDCLFLLTWLPSISAMHDTVNLIIKKITKGP
jgi:hypothetical protein